MCPPFLFQSQPGEIYSNGVTYYNTETQQHLPRSNPPLQKRPKAAIPIVPPPERERKKQERQQQLAAAAEQGFMQKGEEGERMIMEDERGGEDMGIEEQQMRDLERLAELERQLEQEKALEQVRLMEEARAREQERMEAEQQQQKLQDADPSPEAQSPSTSIGNDAQPEQLVPTTTSAPKEEPSTPLETKLLPDEKTVAEPIIITTTTTPCSTSSPSPQTQQITEKVESESITTAVTSEISQADTTTTNVTQPTSPPAESSSSASDGSIDESKIAKEVANQPSSSTETPDLAVAAS